MSVRGEREGEIENGRERGRDKIDRKWTEQPNAAQIESHLVGIDSQC